MEPIRLSGKGRSHQLFAEQKLKEVERKKNEAAMLEELKSLVNRCEEDLQDDLCFRVTNHSLASPNDLATAYRVSCTGKFPQEEMCLKWNKLSEQNAFGLVASSAMQIESARAGCQLEIGKLCSNLYFLESNKELRLVTLVRAGSLLKRECDAKIEGSCESRKLLAERCSLHDSGCKEIRLQVREHELYLNEVARRQESDRQTRELMERSAQRQQELVEAEKIRQDRQMWKDLGDSIQNAFPQKRSVTTHCTSGPFNTQTCRSTED